MGFKLPNVGMPLKCSEEKQGNHNCSSTTIRPQTNGNHNRLTGRREDERNNNNNNPGELQENCCIFPGHNLGFEPQNNSSNNATVIQQVASTLRLIGDLLEISRIRYNNRQSQEIKHIED